MDIRRLTVFALIVVISFAMIGWTSPDLLRDMRLGLDLKGGFEILYQAEPLEGGQEVTRDSLRETARSLLTRADAYGVAEPEIFPEGQDRIRVRIAGVADQDELRDILKRPIELTFRGPDGAIELIGSDFKQGGASAQMHPETRQAEVHIEVDAAKFEEVTRRLTGQLLHIYLDDEVLSSPRVNYTISGGKATISGSYTYTEAKQLADIINLGALPLKLTEIYTQSVGATLGQMSLDQTVRAGIIGSILILLFMVVFYRVPGLVASVTIVVYTWLLILIFDLINVTVTLPGIAAFVLGIGMAVDANIITAERIKEEIRSGKTLLSSLKAGSRNSLRAIMDANLTTILAGAVLYYIGVGAVQGFALILMLSIVASILTNVFLSRFLLALLIRGKLVTRPVFFGVKEAEIREL